MVAYKQQSEVEAIEVVEGESVALADEEVAELAARLDERLAPPFEKRRILQRLGEDAGPRAVSTLRQYCADPDPSLAGAAEEALAAALARTPQGAGYDRNSPCPCGSGDKWKHCCAREEFRWRDARRGRREKLTSAWR